MYQIACLPTPHWLAHVAFALLYVSGMRDRAAAEQLAESLGPAVAGKVIIDATNPLTPYPNLEVLWDGTSGELNC
jgi:hypothetical protein